MMEGSWARPWQTPVQAPGVCDDTTETSATRAVVMYGRNCIVMDDGDGDGDERHYGFYIYLE